MSLVDTNILVYSAVEGCQEQARCRELISSLQARAQPWFATWPIIYEFLRVMTHLRVVPRPLTAGLAWRYVESLLLSPGFKVLLPTDRHAEVAAATLQEYPHLRGSFFHDAHTAILMREHGLRTIYTRDLGFHRFPFLEVVDPLTADRGPFGVSEPSRRRRGRAAASRRAAKLRRRRPSSSRGA